MGEHKPFKINNALLGVVGIFAIFIILYLAITFSPVQQNSSLVQQSTSADLSGQASAVLQNTQSSVCNLIVGQTTIYDDTTLATSLKSGESTYYSGYIVSVEDINSDGCVVNINNNKDYIAVGQIQRLGPLYVTVKGIIE
jgi:hypothetical protein